MTRTAKGAAAEEASAQPGDATTLTGEQRVGRTAAPAKPLAADQLHPHNYRSGECSTCDAIRALEARAEKADGLVLDLMGEVDDYVCVKLQDIRAALREE